MTRALHLRGFRCAEPPGPAATFDRQPEWMFDDRRACAGDERWTADDRQVRAVAAKLCASRQCPFIEKCLKRAIDKGERHHVWGGEDFTRSEVRRRFGIGDETCVPTQEQPATPPRTLRGAMAVLALTKPGLWARLADDGRIQAVKAGVANGMTWSHMARIWGQEIGYLQKLGGQPCIDDQVRELYDAGKCDGEIAALLGVNPKTIQNLRNRYGLVTKFGPGGKLRKAPVPA